MIIPSITDFFKRYNYIFISVLIFGIFSHGYCYFNMNLSHDSLYFDHSYSKNLGRWGQNIVYAIRGKIFPPVLVGFLSLLFIAFATVIYSKIFEIRNKVICVLISGLFVTNFTYTYIAATYIFFLDVNMLAFMIAALAVHLVISSRRILSRLLVSSILLMFAISLYQAYLQAYLAIVVLVFLQNLVKNKPIKDAALQLVSLIIVACVACLIYFISLKVIIFAGVEFSDGYNSINNVGFKPNILSVYKYILHNYAHLPSYKYKVQSAILFILVLYSIYLIIKLCKARANSNVRILLSVLSIIVALPLASNCVYALSNGLMHSLMKYSYSFVFLVPLNLLSISEHPATKETVLYTSKTLEKHSFAISLLISIVLFNSAIFSNQAYWQKDLQAKASLSIMTRVLSQLDNTGGYTPEMTTCFAGSYFSNENILKQGFLNHKLDNSGFSDGLSFTYDNFIYIAQILRSVVRKHNDCTQLLKSKEDLIDKMPKYPQKGYIKIFDNTAVIKMSEKVNDSYGNGIGN